MNCERYSLEYRDAVMKPSAFLLFSSLVGTLQAATLKVGSGQTYSTVIVPLSTCYPDINH